MKPLKNLLDQLNLSEKDGLILLSNSEYRGLEKFPNRIKETINKLNPNAIFCITNEPLLLFFENPKNLDALQKQIWNFNQAPAIFIYENKQWVVKNGFNLLNNKKELEIIAESNNISDFEYFELITGKTWEKYRDKFIQSNRVDYYLLENIETARGILTDTNRKQQSPLYPKIANSLIGRVIFIRYLIDREVELGKKYNIKNKEDFYNILSDKEKTYKFFKQIKEDFNGNLFPLTYEINGIEINEKDFVNETHLNVIFNLLKGYKLDPNSTQPTFFDIYDFSIIPIEFVSNVYEKFIGKDKQAGTGAYYTPLFLVDYIQKETISKYFENNPNEYNCKVLDPACGSGIFLVESLRQVIFQYQKLNPSYKDNDQNYKKYKETLKQLLKDNIFGIDKDEDAISVAIFSLYITLLDNLNPISIVGFQFPQLIGSNFFSNDFFDKGQKFEIELKKHHFHFILGNPPWATKHLKQKQLFEKYIENRKKEESSNLEIVHREIAEAFLVRVSDFSFDETAFIIVSKILYKLEKKGIFRKYFLDRFKIRQVFELSSVRQQIFDKSNDKAVAPATILFYSKSNPNELKTNIVRHISLKPNIFFETFKLMVIEKYDVKKIAQKYFIEEDWMWKVLVYGNILDYYFIKRLRKSYTTIGEVISDKTKFLYGQGLKFKDADRKINTKSYSNYKFIGSLKKKLNKEGKLVNEHTNYTNFLKPYYLAKNNLIDWDCRDVGYFPMDTSIFNENTLLITDGLTNLFKAVSCINYQKALFKDSLTAINSIDKSHIPELKTISSILNSNFFSYYILSLGSSIGIEREHSHDIEKWDVPYNSSKELIKIYSQVEKLSEEYYSADMTNNFLKYQLNLKIETLNMEVIELFSLSNVEKSLIDYANSITIPLLQKNKGLGKRKVLEQLPYKSNLLNQYAQVFIDHFGNRFNSEGSFFEVEIIYSNYTILMKFKIISKPSKHNDNIEWKKQGTKELLQNITTLQFENISNNLFIQKDVKGFEEDFFYIAKPNQYKSWHQALAYLDLSEFIEALHNYKH